MSDRDAEVTEYATRMGSGEMRVRYSDPRIERIYPLALWIEHQQSERKVYRRRVVVIEDWTEVDPAEGAK